MNVLFAPDWRDGVPYQTFLGDALARQGVEIRYLRDYRRLFPLARLVADARKTQPVDVLHVHWPESYFPIMRDRWDAWRRARFPLDLGWAARGVGLAVTAHNLLPHNMAGKSFVRTAFGAAYRQANVVFAHSEKAKDVLCAEYRVRPERVTVIPHGDLAISMAPPLDRAEARARLALGAEPVCLVFGAVEPYKGLEAVVDYWREAAPAARLVIAGKPCNAGYHREIAERVGDAQNIDFRPGWLADEDLRLWFSAADCILFNYRAIFTSGAANLARSYGMPMLMPARLDTTDLGEPTPSVVRFEALDHTFTTQLQQALTCPPDYTAAAAWREAHSWDRVAVATLDAYGRIKPR